MKTRWLGLALIIGCSVGATAQQAVTPAPVPPRLRLRSTFTEATPIPKPYTCLADGGVGVSPPLNWFNVPKGTASFAVTLSNMDNHPAKGIDDEAFWVLWNVPGSASELAQGVAAGAELPDDFVDVDLALVYGVTTKRLNEQVRRNAERFPADFLITLTKHDLTNLRSQFATSSWGGRRYAPLAFTEHGAIMAATILDSPRAVQMSVYVVRAFARLRQTVAAHSKLAQELEALKHSVAVLDADTRRQFDQVYEAILGLMATSPRKQ